MPTYTRAHPNRGRDHRRNRARRPHASVRRTVYLLLSALVLLVTVPTPAPATTYSLRAWCKENAYTLEHAALIAEVFTYEPRMVMVSCCESRGIATAKNKKSSAVGLFQVLRKYWAKYATDNGYNLLTAEGNIAVAAYILRIQGIKAWNESRHCWG